MGVGVQVESPAFAGAAAVEDGDRVDEAEVFHCGADIAEGGLRAVGEFGEGARGGGEEAEVAGCDVCVCGSTS